MSSPADLWVIFLRVWTSIFALKAYNQMHYFEALRILLLTTASEETHNCELSPGRYKAQDLPSHMRWNEKPQFLMRSGRETDGKWEAPWSFHSSTLTAGMNHVSHRYQSEEAAQKYRQLEAWWHHYHHCQSDQSAERKSWRTVPDTPQTSKTRSSS